MKSAISFASRRVVLYVLILAASKRVSKITISLLALISNQAV